MTPKPSQMDSLGRLECAGCEEWLAPSEFHPRSDTPRGRRSHCRVCTSDLNAGFHAAKLAKENEGRPGVRHEVGKSKYPVHPGKNIPPARATPNGKGSGLRKPLKKPRFLIKKRPKH